MKNIKILMSKAAELVAGLDNTGDIEDVHFSVRPYARNGYSNHSLIIFFRDDENGNERESRMYLFHLSNQEWELHK